MDPQAQCGVSAPPPRRNIKRFFNAVGWQLELLFLRLAYRHLMRLTHYFGWHYAPVKPGPDGEGYRWCHWCGLRGTVFDPSKGILRHGGDDERQ